MSVTEYSIEPNPKLWEQYLQECRALEIRPSLSDYQVYLQEQDLDNDD